MKRMIAMLLCLVLPFVFTRCAAAKTEKQEITNAAIANPWSAWSSVAEAEQAAGFSFGLPEVIAGTYVADEIRTMNTELIEVVYRDGDREVRVRKQEGEGQDISGDYNTYDIRTEESYRGGTIISCHSTNNNAVKQLVSYGGYSWSLVAANGYWGDSNLDFLRYIWEIEE